VFFYGVTFILLSELTDVSIVWLKDWDAASASQYWCMISLHSVEVSAGRKFSASAM